MHKIQDFIHMLTEQCVKAINKLEFCMIKDGNARDAQNKNFPIIEYRYIIYLFLLLAKKDKEYNIPKIRLTRNEVDNALKIRSDVGKVKNLVTPLTVDDCVGPLIFRYKIQYFEFLK